MKLPTAPAALDAAESNLKEIIVDNLSNNPPVSRDELPAFLYGRIQSIDSERDTTNCRLEAVKDKPDALTDEIKAIRTDTAQANLTQLRWIASAFAAGIALPLALSFIRWAFSL